MKNAGRVSVDLAPIVARAMAFLNPDAVERFYALSPAKYYADTMRGAGSRLSQLLPDARNSRLFPLTRWAFSAPPRKPPFADFSARLTAKHTIKRMMPLSHPRRARKFRLIPA